MSTTTSASTGPRTPEGKARSALNAVKHGFTAKSPVLPGEDPQPFLDFQTQYLQELKPKSINQATLAQQLVLTSWRLQRMAEAEGRLLAEEAQRLEEEALQDWKAETDRIKRCYLPVPPPEKPQVPVRNEASDIYAAAFQAPKPPVKPRSDFRTPSTSPLERFLRYQSSLQSAYIRLLKQYKDLQQNELTPSPGTPGEGRGEGLPPELQILNPEPTNPHSSTENHQSKARPERSECIENPPPRTHHPNPKSPRRSRPRSSRKSRGRLNGQRHHARGTNLHAPAIQVALVQPGQIHHGFPVHHGQRPAGTVCCAHLAADTIACVYGKPDALRGLARLALAQE
jgi:hypothetical protein